jgi:hypothetical protein
MIIYVSHPYGGIEENKQKVEAIVRSLAKENPQHIYISPIHCFGFMYTDTDYETGLDMCLKLLDKCDKMLVFGDWKSSRGCNAEILYADVNFIPYEIMG